MIQDFAPSQQVPWRLIGSEVLANLATVLLAPFGISQSKGETPRRRSQRTVVLVHGYVSNRSVFLPLQGYLRLVGIKSILSFNYRSGQSPEASAIELRNFIQKRVRGGRVDIVSHSLGGIVSRIFIEQLGGHRRVDRCITLGTPQRGTYSAYWLPTRIGHALRPDSKLLQRLAKHATSAGHVRFTSIIGGSDNIVVPRVFAGHGDDVEVVPDVGHAGLLFCPSVFRLVAERLLQRANQPLVQSTAS